MQIRAVRFAPLLILLAACGREAPAATEHADQPLVQTAPLEEPRRVLTSDRIYYDLTRFEWYARGEPLLHEQLAFQPVGAPTAASLDEMVRTGEYAGVEYYRRSGDDLSLYVPVSDGYWLGFRPAEPVLRAD